MATHKIKKLKLVIFGTGEIGSLARFYFDNDSPYEVAGFVADDAYVQTDTFQGLPLVAFSRLVEKFPVDEYHMHVGLSYSKLNQTRAQRYEAVKALGYQMASYMSSKSVHWPDLNIGENCFILENQTIQPTVKIGNNVMIWSGNHIGHATSIGDHTYISSHVCISGHVSIGTHCFFGVNATVKDFVKIGNSVFVTMGAIITKDIEDGAVVLAAQSEIYQADSKIAVSLKRKYFHI